MVIVNLGSIDVLPPLVQKPAIRQRPGRIVVLDVGGDGSDPPAVAITPMHVGNLSQPAVDPPFRSRGNENQRVIRQPGRFDVIEGSSGQLAEPASIGLDLIQMVMIRAASTIGKDDRLAVVVNGRIPHRSLRVVKQPGHLPRPEVDLGEASERAISLAIGTVGVVAEIGVPVTVAVERPLHENDFTNRLGQRGGGGERRTANRGRGGNKDNAQGGDVVCNGHGLGPTWNAVELPRLSMSEVGWGFGGRHLAIIAEFHDQRLACCLCRLTHPPADARLTSRLRFAMDRRGCQAGKRHGNGPRFLNNWRWLFGL